MEIRQQVGRSVQEEGAEPPPDGLGEDLLYISSFMRVSRIEVLLSNFITNENISQGLVLFYSKFCTKIESMPDKG